MSFDFTRTCNQTVISRRIKVDFVDRPKLSFEIDRVRRSWCETGALSGSPVAVADRTDRTDRADRAGIRCVRELLMMPLRAADS
jgi:hypothetical protein